MRTEIRMKKVELELPEKLVIALKSIRTPWRDFNHKVRLSIALDLFTRGTVSLAKAAELAEMRRYQFMQLLRERGIPLYEYSQDEYQEDQEGIKHYQKLRKKNESSL